MKSFINYAKNRFLYNLLRLLIIFGLGLIASQFMFIQDVKADVVESYYIQDTSDTKSTYWNAYGESGSYWTYNNQYVLFNGTSERYFTISTCLTGNLEMSIVSNKQGITIYSTTQVGESCDVQGYSGRMYYFIFRVNEFYETGGNGQYSAMFDLYVENRNTYKVVQDIFTVSSSADLPNYSSSDANFDEVNDNLTDINDSINDTNEKLDQAETTRKGIWETIKDLPNKLLDMLKSLFIPEDDFFTNWFDDFMTFVELKLGFLATPFTLFIDFIESYLNLDSSNDVIINIPDITVPNFEDNIIVHATTFNWSETLRSKESLNALWQLYLDFIDVFLILNFLGLCENVYNRIFGGNTANYEYYTVEDSYTYDNETGEVLSSRRNERTTRRKKVDS